MNFWSEEYHRQNYWEVENILSKNEKQTWNFVQFKNYFEFDPKIDFVSNKLCKTKSFLLNIYSGCEIDELSKKEFWKSKFVKIYKRQFENYYHVNYLNREFNFVTNSTQFYNFEKNNFIEFAKSTREILKTNSITILNFELIDYFNALIISRHFVFFILNYWKIQQSFFSKFFVMTKNILTILCVEVEIERLFNMIKNVIIYRRDRFNSNIIEIVMLIKFVAFKNSSYEIENTFVYREFEELCANEFFVKTTKKTNFAWINDDDENVQIEENIQKQNDDDETKDLFAKKNIDEMKKMIFTKNIDVKKTMFFNKWSRLKFSTFFSLSSMNNVHISKFKKTQNVFFLFVKFRSSNI